MRSHKIVLMKIIAIFLHSQWFIILLPHFLFKSLTYIFYRVVIGASDPKTQESHFSRKKFHQTRVHHLLNRVGSVLYKYVCGTTTNLNLRPKHGFIDSDGVDIVSF